MAADYAAVIFQLCVAGAAALHAPLPKATAPVSRRVGSLAATQPALADFTRFHAMHCSPLAARQCVASFSGGCIVFAPSTYEDADFPAEEGMVSRFEVPKLTTLKYYALVLASLTGLCTALQMTTIVDAREGLLPEEAEAASTHPLHPSRAVLDYVSRRAGAPLTGPVRRFEFMFRLVNLRVVMLHYASRADEGVAPALHLVEVYEGRASRAVGLTAGALAVAGVAAALARRVILL